MTLFGIIKVLTKAILYLTLKAICTVGYIIAAVSSILLNMIATLVVIAAIFVERVQNLLFGNGPLLAVIYVLLLVFSYIFVKYVPMIVIGLCEEIADELI